MMGDLGIIPTWLKGLPLAPEYHPTETEFADPIAYISKIEKEASTFGICKVVPPLPKPSKKFVLSNLNKSLSRCPELGSDSSSPCASATSQMGPGDKENEGESQAVFTTRHQELGHSLKRTRGSAPISQPDFHKKVWQSGEAYTIDQFELKSKAFARSHLGNLKEVSPIAIEALFWKAAFDKPIYIEYANDVPGSGFGKPLNLFRYFHKRKRKQKSGGRNGNYGKPEVGLEDSKTKQDDEGSTCTLLGCSDREGTAGWKLSNSPWNLQVIARSLGSLTRFMPDDIPGVTSPMVYIGMLFSWFAWHVEDHELHSLNFLHMGSPKTWYGVPGNFAFALEEVIRAQGYGGTLDQLAALTLLGEKTTLLSPEVIVASGIPCCRLVQNPGEFVVTFPRAYHVGFSHGFNCGEAANFATPQWLKVAKEAAVRRAAMNYLPMLSHQQLLYMLTMSFASRVPRALLPGVRSSRLKDRKKEEREILVKKAFLDDMVKENHLVSVLLDKESTSYAVLWDPEWLPSVCNGSPGFLAEKEKNVCNNISCLEKEEGSGEYNANITKAYLEQVNNLYADGEDDLPCGLHVDSGALACVACGLLGFPFMAIIQPSAKAVEDFFSRGSQVNKREKGKIKTVKSPTSFMELPSESDSEGAAEEDQTEMLTPECMVDIPVIEDTNLRKKLMLLTNGHEIGANKELSMSTALPSPTSASSSIGLLHNSIASMNINGSNIEMLADTKFDSSNGAHTYNHSGESEAITEVNIIVKANPGGNFNLDTRPCVTAEVLKPPSNNGDKFMKQWNTSSEFRRPRIFCLEHSLEIQQRMDLMGGVNVLIICHSDYPKIKEQALHIAEEIGVDFNCLDVPLANATQADLNLINISIDDEGHEECGEDWTSKLGLNLKYRVKLQKLFPSKKEHHTLALGGLFSDQVHGLNVPSLKWVSRRSRTHHKANRFKLFKKEDDQVREILDGEVHHSGGSGSESCPQLQPSRPRDRGRPRKRSPKEVFSCKDTIATIEEDCRNNGNEKTCSDFVALAIPSNSGNEKTCTDLVALALPTLPVSTPEASEKLEEIQSTWHMDMAGGTSHPCTSFSLLNVDILEADTSQEQKEIQITETECLKNDQEIPLKGEENKETAGVFTTIVAPQNEFSKGQLVIQSVEETILSVEVGDSTESEGPLNAAILTIENSGVHQNISTRERTSTEGEVSDSEKSASLSPTCKSLVESSVTELDLGTTQIPVIGKIYDSEEPGVSPSVILGGERYEIKHVVSTTGQTVVTGETCDPVELPGPPLSNRTLENSQMHADTQVIDEVRIVEEDCTSLTLENQPAFANTNSSEVQGFHMGEEVTPPSVICTKGSINIENGASTLVNLKAKKRKREMEMKTNDQLNDNSFIRSPCEGLRSRTGKVVANEAQIAQTSDDKGQKVMKQHSKFAASSVKSKTKEEAYRCGTEGCCMSFATKAELNLHKQNRCTHEGCGKRFGSHRYVVYHQKVHADERPLKCPWKGCKMSFKWSWARTEHLRVHTGERPYKCKVPGCSLTFRFVSDFSRHRRKTAHFVD